jgi:cellulose synthase/poly-beta-1,6-N-acetylglucosamine synthase-like glycosyltransferase
MATFIILAEIVLSLIQVVVVVGLGYYYFLLLASIPRRRRVSADHSEDRSFAVAIPAHNEGVVLAETLRALDRQSYPADLYDVHVVADHCDDDTAQVARENGAICYERGEGVRGRKAYALQWLLGRILGSEKDYDALVIFDADSRVEPGFLRAMNAALGPSCQVLQGKHVIASPEEGRFSGLAAVDMRLNNLLRNQARQNLGLSCRLMGDAMCFATPVIRRYGWPADSLGEDREYGLFLLTQGIRVRYVPGAVSVGQAAPSWRSASAQRLRWYGGVSQIQRRFVLKLLGLGVRELNWAALDQAVELLLPPLSVLAILSFMVTVVHWLWPSLRLVLPLTISTGAAIAWGLFPFLGLLIDRAPGSAFLTLLYGPFYVLWRLWIGLLARVRGRRVRWVRTTRHEESST